MAAQKKKTAAAARKAPPAKRKSDGGGTAAAVIILLVTAVLLLIGFFASDAAVLGLICCAIVGNINFDADTVFLTCLSYAVLNPLPVLDVKRRGNVDDLLSLSVYAVYIDLISVKVFGLFSRWQWCSHFAHAGTAATTAEMMQIKATPTTTATNRPKTFTLIRSM